MTTNPAQIDTTSDASRNIVLGVRLNAEERAQFTEAARQVGLTPNVWLRMLGLQASKEAQR